MKILYTAIIVAMTSGSVIAQERLPDDFRVPPSICGQLIPNIMPMRSAVESMRVMLPESEMQRLGFADFDKALTVFLSKLTTCAAGD